ncbi:MAG: acetoin utilization protein AcuC [Chromatiales bacterium]|nr:MAG: acetoin utilization protein AcuC [Chromatiales bacterium]
MNANGRVLVLKGENIAAYGFGDGHPFGPDRHDVFHAALAASGLDVELAMAGDATREELEAFHAPGYLDFVAEACAVGSGFLDGGDTPALGGIDIAATAVVGATLFAVNAVMEGRAPRAFVPIAGLHHAGRSHASGFCVFNDCGVALEMLRNQYGLRRVAYVDIDAHHGDGVYYAFEADPDVTVVDIHEDGRFLFPGTGHAHESGAGGAAGTKLNIPLPPGAGDRDFLAAWERAEAFLEAAAPEFILLQCGADSLAGDPITHLQLTAEAHGEVAARLARLADRHCAGRMVGTGGGGYNRDNLARGWTAVVQALVATT